VLAAMIRHLPRMLQAHRLVTPAPSCDGAAINMADKFLKLIASF
jgi:hypothetical protein